MYPSRQSKPGAGTAPQSISEDAPLVDNDQQTLLWPPRRMEVQPWRERLSAHSNLETWEFPGWGNNEIFYPKPGELEDVARSVELATRKKQKLNAFEATAICANDLLSSPLYVVGLVTFTAGKLAPVALLMVSGVLYLFKGMYGEAISALPLDGGAFNILMNTSTKPWASFAATLALLAYTATAVVSACTAVDYLDQVAHTGLPPVLATLCLLGVLALLRVTGIRATAIFSQVIFCFHLVTLTSLCVASLMYMAWHPKVLWHNLHSDYPPVDVAGNTVKGSFWTALFFGYASAILGVSGYETSAQFVQEQGPGVFVQTLSNLWLLVLLFNPLMAFLALGVVPLDTIDRDEYTVLAQMARRLGHWLKPDTLAAAHLEQWVCLDAFLVLSGAVLSTHVGVSGLVRRMAADKCMPEWLLNKNRVFDTWHNIPLAFLLITATLVLVLRGDVTMLSGVYRLAFLSVLLIFSVGVMTLKFKRPTLLREVTISWWGVVLGFVTIFIGLIGNMVGRPQELEVFLSSIFIGGTIVLMGFQRKHVLRLMVRVARKACPPLAPYLMDEVAATRTSPAVFFIKRDDVYILNKALLYVTDNEDTQRLLVVHFFDRDHPPPPSLAKHVSTLDTVYPRIQSSLLCVQAPFTPVTIEWLSRELFIPKNMMFMACPAEHFKHKLAEHGEIRIITH